MNRIAQGLTLVLLGAAALTSTVVTDLYLNYVKAAFGPFLVAAGVVTVVLGVLVVLADLRGEGAHANGEDVVNEAHAEDAVNETEAEAAGDPGGHGHDHSRAPRVAWLLLLPVAAVFVVAPPALGSYTVQATPNSAPPVDNSDGRFQDGLSEAGPNEVAQMAVQEFVLRAWVDEKREMAGREIEMTGFAVPVSEGEGWYLARLQMACCAADAIVNRVLITGEPAPEKDSWWTVRGTWAEPQGELHDVSDHRFEVHEMTEVDNPPDPYE